MSDYLELKGKRALVTGGTKGVGQAVVATLREPARSCSPLPGHGLNRSAMQNPREAAGDEQQRPRTYLASVRGEQDDGFAIS